MFSEISLKFLFVSAICLLVVGSSYECKPSGTRANVAAPIAGIVFFPDVNISLPSGQMQKQITCTGDCDEDAFKLIQCKGNYREKDYKCELVDAIPNYELIEYEATCIENRPVRTENCYLFITLNKTLIRWQFDSRQEIEHPTVPGNYVAQVLCNGVFCDQMEYTLVECLGVFAKQDYDCSILEPPLPSKFELADYSIICKNYRSKSNEDCFVVVRVDEKQTQVGPDNRTRKILLAIGVAIVGLLLATSIAGCLIYFLNR